MKVFCQECQKQVDYKEEVVFIEERFRGKRLKYPAKAIYCSICDKELNLKEVRDYNKKSRDDAYRKEEGIISLDNIKRILDKYAIGKRPLSLLLGWGEGTLTRYLDGDIPSKPYSDTLLNILNDEEYFKEILEQNKDKITDLAYKKSLNALEFKEINNFTSATKSKIESAARYLLFRASEITPLALQKLLYFAQGFQKAFTGQFLFEEDCEAWVHGPVYPAIYKRYKDIGCHPVNMDEIILENINLTEDEKELLEHIVLYFGCYSGRILEHMTHIEEPWRNTRKGLDSFEEGNKIIPKEEIASYFESVRNKYKMLNFTDMKDYSIDLFSKINL